jgi:hypothetical protein
MSHHRTPTERRHEQPMCDIDNDEEPTYEVAPFGTYRPLADTSQAIIALDDSLDTLAQREIGQELQAKIREALLTMFDAIKAIVTNPEDIPSILAHADAANNLHDLAEQAMLLIEEDNDKETVATDGR